jgi:hypothetical protein
LDSSDLVDALEFIYNVTEWLTIGDNDTLVSLVTYSDNIREEFNLGNHTNRTELLNAINDLSGMQSGGGTYTFDALEYVAVRVTGNRIEFILVGVRSYSNGINLCITFCSNTFCHAHCLDQIA